MFQPPPTICSSVAPAVVKLNLDPQICPVSDLNVLIRQHGKFAIIDSDAKHSSVNSTVNRIRRNLEIADFSPEEVDKVILRLYDTTISNLITQNNQHSSATTIQINKQTIVDVWQYIRKYSLHSKYTHVQPPHIMETFLNCPEKLDGQEEDNYSRTCIIWADLIRPFLSIQLRARMDFLAHEPLLKKYLRENNFSFYINQKSAYWRLSSTVDQRLAAFFREHLL
jgi:hypothetical protein